MRQRVPRVRRVGARAGGAAHGVDVPHVRRARAATRARTAPLVPYVPCAAFLILNINHYQTLNFKLGTLLTN